MSTAAAAFRRPVRTLGVLGLGSLLTLQAPLQAAPLSPTPGAAASGSPAGLLPLPPAAPRCTGASAREDIPSSVPLLHLPERELGGSSTPADAPPARASLSDYSLQMATTALGRPLMPHWCVWIEPPSGKASSALWEVRWRGAVDRALARWQALLPIELVADPAAAQVWIWRRRPPLLEGPDGRRRASHGRATLALQRVQRQGISRLEPAVTVLLSPAQREAAMEATALHELGHAFGLWGHSEDPADAMAAVPGAAPVLNLTDRDRATLIWLYRQPTPFGKAWPTAP